MPPTLILIRHGQAEHNATKNWGIPDPPLTAQGREQCRQLEEQLRTKCPLADKVEAIVTSPFVRTIETTNIGLDWLIRKGIRIEPNALWQENAAKPCDTGTPVIKLREQFPEIDFSDVDTVFPSKKLPTKYAFTRAKVLARGQLALEQLYRRPEAVIAVVTHSGFLRTAVCQRRFANADYRIFTFASDKDLSLIEADETEGTGGMGWSEPGAAEIEDGDFPREQADAEATKEIP